MTKYWYTLDGRKIPIKYMTTTHLANAMYHCDKRNTPSFKPPLLEEWKAREAEGILRKARRFIGRVAGRYYKKITVKIINNGGGNGEEFDYT